MKMSAQKLVIIVLLMYGTTLAHVNSLQDREEKYDIEKGRGWGKIFFRCKI